MFKSYAFKRRLLLPYLPLFGMLRNWSNTTLSTTVCWSVFSYTSLVSSLVIIGIYTSTVIRFIYMRNLYTFLANGKFPTLQRRLISTPIGIALIVAFTIVLNVIVIGPTMIVLATIPNVTILQVTQAVNYVGVIVVFLALILSLICVTVDMILNRKSIRKYGLMKFLLFDDPFYMRIDLMFTFFILVCLIVFVSVTTVSILLAILDLLISIQILLICSGNVMIIELIKRIIYRNRDSSDSESFENLLRNNKTLYELMVQYSTKEYSLENIKMYESLNEYYHQRKSISIDELIHIETEYLNSFSKYEVNVPSSVKKQVSQLITDLQHDPNLMQNVSMAKSRKEQVIESMFIEVVKNLLDTYSRLQHTKEYQAWLEIYNIQKSHAAVIDDVA